MKSHFSEFTYGYTLVEELSRSSSFTAVPTFPSLIEEGKVGGYDVALKVSGLPFFLQFKRSDHMVRRSAKYYSVFGSSYYRFNLHALRHSKQHNLLLQLENCGYPVFYVAPKFHENKELHNNYFNSSIASESIWITPIEIGPLPDKDEHSICFNSTASRIYFCSEPRVLKLSIRSGLDGVTEHLNSFSDRERGEELEREREEKKDFSQKTWKDLFSQMEKIVRTHDEMSYRKISKLLKSEANIITKTAKLSRLSFGSDMMVYNNRGANN